MFVYRHESSRSLARLLVRFLWISPGVSITVLLAGLILISVVTYKTARSFAMHRSALALASTDAELFSQDSLTVRVDIPTRFTFRLKEAASATTIRSMRVTSYANRTEETDSTPNIGACGASVFEGAAAVSQDLFNKKFFCGDVVCIKKTRKCYVIYDTMNARFKKAIDIFMDKSRTQEERNVLFHSDVVVLHNKK